MMCHSIGLPPISTIGFGRTAVSSLSREPNPPAKITAFTRSRLAIRRRPESTRGHPGGHRSLTGTIFDAPVAYGKSASLGDTARNS